MQSFTNTEVLWLPREKAPSASALFPVLQEIANTFSTYKQQEERQDTQGSTDVRVHLDCASCQEGRHVPASCQEL